ncbi:MAG: hypothetical protein QXE52_08085 [Candidatus Caldarchaeum sp.]
MERDEQHEEDTMKLEVIPDESGYLHNPREWDNAWTLVPLKKFRYKELFDTTDVTLDREDFTDYEDVDCKALQRKTGEKIALAVTVYALNHGAIVFSRGHFYDYDPCRWDWGIAGAAYITRKNRRWFATDEDALKCLDGELDELTAYANGDMWGYRILDDGGNEISSCYGYYSEEDARQAGEEALENLERVTPKQLTLPL